MALDDALERALRAYDKDRGHPAPVDIVAQHIGYKSANNGSALQAIASLRYYGLLDRPSDGLLAVNKDVEAYRFAPDEKVRAAILTRFLKAPTLFAELLEKYEEGLPSEATLKYDLIQKGFIPSAAEAVLSAFRRSVAFVGYYESKHGVDEEPSEPENGLGEGDPRREDSPTSPRDKSQSPFTVSEPEEAVDKIPVRLPGGRRAWLVIPTPFYTSDKARIKAQVDLLLTEDDEE